ncbi:MAG: hypothetical protein NT062_24090, partial [Proteobacteria bacterium]|nr:hypothetical protein [Pseudomonadota bacterium]
RAAARLYRDNGRAEPAAATYRAIVARRPTDVDAWRALVELYGEMERWDELADVRAELAGRTDDGVVKSTHLRGQAEALERAGDRERAATIVEQADKVAPASLSGIVDTVLVLARNGRPREAADLLAARLQEAIASGAADTDVTAIQHQLAAMLEDGCGDRAASAEVLGELLARAPDHRPALERLVWQASHDPDPRVHAQALERLADATPTPTPRDQLATLTQAARRFRDAQDYAASARVFDRARALAPHDAALAVEHRGVTTALATLLAKDAVREGNTAAAETRLQAIIDADATNLDASLALAEIYQRSGRLGTARDHLAATLAAAADDAPPAQLAQLVYRHALVVRELGDDDYAHQLLHEAHHLARRDLVITLALGESCFARKLWREAALHLGSLAEHPEAARHAAAVAIGLVHAAHAEVRGLRPANAPKHFDAAIRIDPTCTLALHALAEQALEKGDTVRGVDLLEREARVTIDPDKRLRLLHALGDLVIELLGDEVRAIRLWASAPADLPPTLPELAVVLDKLAGLQRARALGAELAVTCARLATCVPEPRATELRIEALQAFARDGDLVSARELARVLVATHPHDARAIEAATQIVIALGDFELAKSWLRPALTVLDKAGTEGADAPRRAELWRRLGDAERARDNERAALAAYQRAIAIAPDAPGGLGARRGLVELAARSGASGASVATSLTALVEAEQDPGETLAWARALAQQGTADPEDVRTAYELASALDAPLTPADEEVLARLPVIGMASDQGYGAVLDEHDRAALIDDADDAPIAALLELV